MKTILKILSVMLILISSLSFAQTDCLPHLPIEIGIKKPIKTNQYNWNFSRAMDQERMTSYLIVFNNSFKKHSSGEIVPSAFVEFIDKIDTKNQTLTNELVSNSVDFQSLRENILNRLKISKDSSEIESLIIMEYSIQIIENSGLFTKSSSLSWECIAKTIGFSSSALMSSNLFSVDTVGNPSGGIAGGGCTPQFPFPRPKNCN